MPHPIPLCPDYIEEGSPAPTPVTPFPPPSPVRPGKPADTSGRLPRYLTFRMALKELPGGEVEVRAQIEASKPGVPSLFARFDTKVPSALLADPAAKRESLRELLGAMVTDDKLLDLLLR